MSSAEFRASSDCLFGPFHATPDDNVTIPVDALNPIDNPLSLANL